jgi:hypothetical protein
MRAALIEAFGEPTEVLELVDVPEPTGPAAGEVLVGVEYALINTLICVDRDFWKPLRQGLCAGGASKPSARRQASLRRE